MAKAKPTPSNPLRGEVWTVNFNPTRGREQAGIRPALVVSVNAINRGPAELVVVLPITSTQRGVPLHVRIDKPEAGVSTTSFAMAEAVRSVSKDRLASRWGAVSVATMAEVEDRLRILLGL